MKKTILLAVGLISATLLLAACSSDSAAQKVSPKEFSEVIFGAVIDQVKQSKSWLMLDLPKCTTWMAELLTGKLLVDK